jgi:hypothetical protein
LGESGNCGLHVREEGSERTAGEINDEVDRFEGVAVERFGGKTGDGVMVGEKSLLGGDGDTGDGIKSGAGGFDDVGGEFAGDGLGHETVAGVAEAHEEDAELAMEHEGSLCWER